MDAKTLSRRKVYGAIQRIIHAWLGAIVVALVMLGWIGKLIEPGAVKYPLIQAHIVLGYGLIVGLVARLIWGLIGPGHARFSALLHGTEWVSALRNFRMKTSNQFGHDVFASAAYLALYGLLVLAAVSGLALAGMKHDMGPLAFALFDDFSWLKLARDIHEAVLYAATAFTVLHIAAMLGHEKHQGYPIAQAMISGYQYRLSSQEEKGHD